MTLSVFAAGCSVEPIREEQPPGQKRKSVPGDAVAGTQQDAAHCRVTPTKGCFDGHVAAKTVMFVGGKQFFNADDLAVRFKELVNVQVQGKPANLGDGAYQLTLLTALDNVSFLQGFNFDLRGPLARAGQIRTDGNFSADELPEGDYEMRVHKPVKFLLAKVNPPAPVSTQPADARPTSAAADDTAAKTAAFCATIYADSSLNIRAGQRVWNTLNEFQLHVTDHECPVAGQQTTLNL